MDYNKLIRTLGRKKLSWANVDGEIWVTNWTVAIKLNASSLPYQLRNNARETSELASAIHAQKALVRDKTQSINIVLPLGNTYVLPYKATRQDGSTYPVFVNKKYIDLLGGEVSVYGTGGDLLPLFYVGCDCDAFIYPVRIPASYLDAAIRQLESLKI